jgi:hypothetical protein
VLDTYCTQSAPSSVHSRGGRIELRISPVAGDTPASAVGAFPGFLFPTRVVVTNVAVSYFTRELVIVLQRAP